MVCLSTSQVSFVLLVLLSAVTFNRSICCNEKDERALLMFKEGVVDPSNCLSNWFTQQDCCAWPGVTCDHPGGRVAGLDLSNQNGNDSESLRGEINLSLLQLEFLNCLNLSYNDFEGISISMPSIDDFAVAQSHSPPNFSKIEMLDLSFNYHLHMDDLHWLSSLSSLKYLDLSGIDLHKQNNWLQLMASLPSLSELTLKDCHLTNVHPSVKNVNLSSLEILDLAENDFNSELPKWLLNLSSEFYYLNLSYCGLRGQIPDLSRYQNLIWLILSNNKLKGSIPNWLGQIEFLRYIDLAHNLLYGSIPSSLENLIIVVLDLRFNNLTGNLPIHLSVMTSQFLGLSHNSLSGNLSNMRLSSESIFMAFNNFTGELPHISEYVQILDLSYNSLLGQLSPLSCTPYVYKNRLQYLDISNNFLFGELPDCWTNWTQLVYMYLGNNKLTGELPPTTGSLGNLELLDLHNNGFSGHIPMSLQNCTNLVLINLERNNFSGSIPNWMPQSVSILKFRSNQFTGNIPPQLCSFFNLTVLDLADNKLSGLIPHCLYKLTAMVSSFPNNSLVDEYPGYNGPIQDAFDYVSIIGKAAYIFKILLSTKGQNLEYSKNLKLVRSIDLSANQLSGEIPPQLFRLINLQSLNLSYNHLTSEVPNEIGRMTKIESLDFSHNKLHGRIPQSISNLSFLSDLNLSYNNFIGQIPPGTQLQSFDAWSYIGNPELCGAPLIKNCTKPEKPNQKQLAEEDEDNSFLKSLYLGMGVGFAVGFWIVSGSLFLSRVWRHTFFRFFDGVVDRIYVFVALKYRSFRRMLRTKCH